MSEIILANNAIANPEKLIFRYMLSRNQKSQLLTTRDKKLS